jgi:glutaminase
MRDLAAVFGAIAEAMRGASRRGADCIPPLVCVSPDRFGIAVVLTDGTEYLGGDAGAVLQVQLVFKFFHQAWRWALAVMDCGSGWGASLRAELQFDRIGKWPGWSVFEVKGFEVKG